MPIEALNQSCDSMADLWDQPLVLVVDDSEMQRRILTTALSRWGYKVIEAASGREALDLCDQEDFSIIVSDWVMPGMTGPEFCAAFRDEQRATYTYFFLLTSKNNSDEIAEGLNSGADDFLTKPIGLSELKARMKAGERIVTMQTQLLDKNKQINFALERIQSLYDGLNRDLKEAQKLQQSLVPERCLTVTGGQLSMLLKPAGHIGGDLVGYFPVSDTEVGIFSLDVSGHGISSALMTARLAGYLSSMNPKQNVALRRTSKDGFEARDPAATATRLNDMFLRELETEHYFTMALSIINLETGLMRSVQAGHPHPILLRKGQSPMALGEGGLPVGLVPAANFTSFETQLHKGDRLVLYSDGITECAKPSGEMLEEAGLVEFLLNMEHLRGSEMLDSLVDEVWAFNDERPFDDDLSLLMFDYDGPQSGLSDPKHLLNKHPVSPISK